MQYHCIMYLERMKQNHLLDHDLALSNAPEAEDGYFKVPRVVQE